MTALSDERARDTENWSYHEFTLTGVKAWKGAQLFLILGGSSKGKVTDTPTPLTSYLGVCWRTVDATAADALVTVRLDMEAQGLEWLENGDTIVATDVGKPAYAQDDQTVYKAATAGALIGRILAYSSSLGVLVQKFNGKMPCGVGVLTAFAAAATALTYVQDGAVYDIPATAANSTIDLPAATDYPDGHSAIFIGDGTKNAHTITVRDVTTAITAALTASKRLRIAVTAMGGKWFASAAIGP